MQFALMEIDEAFDDREAESCAFVGPGEPLLRLKEGLADAL